MTRWRVATAEKDSAALDALLAAGWEPFAVYVRERPTYAIVYCLRIAQP